jgi:hypothetical protein
MLMNESIELLLMQLLVGWLIGSLREMMLNHLLQVHGLIYGAQAH